MNQRSSSGGTGIVPFNDSQLEMFRGDRWILKSPAFLKARYDWTVNMHRVVDCLIKQLDQIDPEARDFGVQFVPVADIVKATGKKGGLYVQLVKDAIQSLKDCEIGVWWEMLPQSVGKDAVLVTKAGDEGVYIDTKVFLRCASIPGAKIKRLKDLRDANVPTDHLENDVEYLMATLNTDMAPVILGLRVAIAYQEKEVIAYQSPYTVRIAQRCLAWYRSKQVTYWRVYISELKETMVLTDKYQRFADFNRRVLKQARKEINNNEHSKFRIEYDTVPRGKRPATTIEFKITPRHLYKKDNEEEKRPVDEAQTSLDYGDMRQESRVGAARMKYESLGESEKKQVHEEVVDSMQTLMREMYLEAPTSLKGKACLESALVDYFDGVAAY